MIWFISDTHFCHDKDFIWKQRGYKDVQEMNKDLINKWNSTVAPYDVVYHLGDVMLNDNSEGIRILNLLNGHKFIIPGNHDTKTRIELYKLVPNVSMLGYAEIYKYNRHRTFYLSHYPTLVGNIDENKKLWNICGHIHTFNRFELSDLQIYNVCVDAHDGFPTSIEEIIKDIRKYQGK